MSDRATAAAIQKDWKEREMIEIVHLNILKVQYRNRIRYGEWILLQFTYISKGSTSTASV